MIEPKQLLGWVGASMVATGLVLAACGPAELSGTGAGSSNVHPSSDTQGVNANGSANADGEASAEDDNQEANASASSHVNGSGNIDSDCDCSPEPCTCLVSDEGIPSSSIDAGVIADILVRLDAGTPAPEHHDAGAIPPSASGPPDASTPFVHDPGICNGIATATIILHLDAERLSRLLALDGGFNTQLQFHLGSVASGFNQTVTLDADGNATVSVPPGSFQISPLGALAAVLSSATTVNIAPCDAANIDLTSSILPSVLNGSMAGLLDCDGPFASVFGNALGCF